MPARNFQSPMTTAPVFALLLGLFSAAASAVTFTVTNTNSASTAGGCDADCSLHDAIVSANATTAADVIQFNIAGTGIKTITLDADGLPDITRPVTIDGYSQGNASANTAATGSNAVLNIALTRSNPNPMNDTLLHALTFTATATGSQVRGIAFVQLGSTNLAFISTQADNMQIDGNFFGLTAAGNADGGQAPNAAISAGASANNAAIGGSTAAARNLFAGVGKGIFLLGTNAIVRNNVFGYADNGSTVLALDDIGVQISGSGHQIGGTGASDGNVFANGDSSAVFIGNSDANTGNRILRNTFENHSRVAIDLQAVGDVPAMGDTPNDPNDADAGANHLQNYPEIVQATRSGTTTTVNARLDTTASRTYRIEVYSNDATHASGFGEGQRFVSAQDVTTDAQGVIDFTVLSNGNALLVGDFVSMTATDLTTNETSEFSFCATVQGTLFDNGFE